MLRSSLRALPCNREGRVSSEPKLVRRVNDQKIITQTPSRLESDDVACDLEVADSDLGSTRVSLSRDAGLDQAYFTMPSSRGLTLFYNTDHQGYKVAQTVLKNSVKPLEDGIVK